MYRWLVTIFILLMPSIAAAHSPLSATNPSDGAIVTAAPEVITLHFEKPSTLVKFALQSQSGGMEMADYDTSFARGEDVKHIVTIPRLSPGKFTAKWRAMSADGHLIKGDFSFAITP